MSFFFRGWPRFPARLVTVSKVRLGVVCSRKYDTLLGIPRSKACYFWAIRFMACANSRMFVLDKRQRYGGVLIDPPPPPTQAIFICPRLMTEGSERISDKVHNPGVLLFCVRFWSMVWTIHCNNCSL
ncbi:hypothetical protein XELAEV_18036048mg [Xenopus laevis]|uniref:Uncharacterized protein n=1 Tax=Xenopus laevis TaxID=8355 RepID=A0A974HCM0_XENLA|nr:hypothetical protein XELAEV_18036048mg [Xenopus laevis]